MAFNPDVVAALNRLAGFYNGGTYDPQSNPGGFGNGGHRLRFAPSLADVALVVNAIGGLQSQVDSAQQILGGMQAYLGAIGGAPGLAEALAAKASIGSKSVSNANYQATATDVEIAMRGMTVSRTVTLPNAASYPPGQDFIVIDADGSCSEARMIVIQAGAGDTINGQAQIILFDSYQSICLRRGASNLWIRLQ